jgi:hypothetical protein
MFLDIYQEPSSIELMQDASIMIDAGNSLTSNFVLHW